MVVQKNTRFRIDKFSYSGTEDGTEWAVFELVKGGLRAISGAIGHARAKRYGVRTSYGTIGIRGTAYQLLVCETECTLGEQRTYAKGMHAETTEGVIFIENTAGVLDIPAGKSAYVKNAQTLPEFTTFSPNFVLRDAPSTIEDPESGESVDELADNTDSERFDVAVGADAALERDPGISSLTVATKTSDARVDSGAVRILSRPGQALVIGMKADMTKSLIQATAAINGDVLAPIVALDTPAVSIRPANDRGAVDSIRSAAPARQVVRPHTRALPHGTTFPRVAVVRGAAIAKSVHGAALAHSAAQAKVILHNVDAIAAARGGALRFRTGLPNKVNPISA